MSFSLSDITFLIRLLLDILVVWGLIFTYDPTCEGCIDYRFNQGFSRMARFKCFKLFD